MKILALDTSATAASVAIAEENKIEGEFFINTALTHSQTLIPMIEQLLKNTGINLKNIDAVAVNAGPGSFTGVRIGVAAAKGLAFPDDLSCISVSSLYSMAYNMLGYNCIVCAVMDARCSQVYNSIFRVHGNTVDRLTDDRALSLEDLKFDLSKFNENIILVGDGAAVTENFLNNSFENVIAAPINHRIQNASSTAIAAYELYKKGEIMSCSELMPLYLRLPQAQRELNKKMGVK